MCTLIEMKKRTASISLFFTTILFSDCSVFFCFYDAIGYLRDHALNKQTTSRKRNVSLKKRTSSQEVLSIRFKYKVRRFLTQLTNEFNLRLSVFSGEDYPETFWLSLRLLKNIYCIKYYLNLLHFSPEALHRNTANRCHTFGSTQNLNP